MTDSAQIKAIEKLRLEIEYLNEHGRFDNFADAQADIIELRDARIASLATEKEEAEKAWVQWLVGINYPFDFTFQPAPPVDVTALGLEWKASDNWGDVTNEDSIALISEESGIALPTPAIPKETEN